MKKHYHLIGIGGVGMGAIASLLLDKGEIVSGSDMKEGHLTKMLQAKGAQITIGHDEKNITFPDYVVYSTAVKKDNPEFLKAQERNIPILQRAQMLSLLMEGSLNITVAGAHGKTTTTSMISNLLIYAGLRPTTAIGGIIEGTTNNAQLGDGKYFVSEVDESDGSFLYFRPQYSVITNIDFEHIDYYHTWENILENYKKYIERTSLDGLLFGYGDDLRLLKLLKESGRNYFTYGFQLGNNLVLQDMKTNDFQSSFHCVFNGMNLGLVELPVPGKHNVADALACILVGLSLNIPFEIIIQSLKRYQTVNRRFQLLGIGDEVMVVDDYAHHPTEIQSVLETAISIKKERLIVVFQPHRYTRLKYLQEEFAKSLLGADYLIITDIYAASEDPIEGVNPQNLCRLVSQQTDMCVKYSPREKVLKNLLAIIRPGDMVLTLGAGDITKFSHELIDYLQRCKMPVE